jgi:hypothetical protein
MLREFPTVLEECFQTPIEEALYADLIDRLRTQRAIRPAIDASGLVHTAWDLGSPINTVVWYFSVVNAEIRVIDCDSDLDLTSVQRVARMLAKGYPFLTELNEIGLRNPAASKTPAAYCSACGKLRRPT